MRSILQRLKRSADEVVPPFDSTAKLLKWMSVVFVAGFTAGAFFYPYGSALLSFLSSRESPAISTGISANACVDGAEISKLQSVYSAEVRPIIARWLEATKEIERSDLLPSEHTKRMTAQALLRGEIERIQTTHERAISLLAQACKPKQ